MFYSSRKKKMLYLSRRCPKRGGLASLAPQGYCSGTSVIWQICFKGEANQPLPLSFLNSWQIKDLDCKNTEIATYQMYHFGKDVRKQKNMWVGCVHTHTHTRTHTHTCVYKICKVFMEHRVRLKETPFFWKYWSIILKNGKKKLLKLCCCIIIDTSGKTCVLWPV